MSKPAPSGIITYYIINPNTIISHTLDLDRHMLDRHMLYHPSQPRLQDVDLHMLYHHTLYHQSQYHNLTHSYVLRILSPHQYTVAHMYIHFPRPELYFLDMKSKI